MEIEKQHTRDIFLPIMAGFLAVSGIISLYASNHLPTSLLDGIHPGKISFLETVLRGWIFYEKASLLDFEIALCRFAAFTFISAALIILYRTTQQKIIAHFKFNRRSVPFFIGLLLIAIFAGSILVRSHSLNQPLGVRYEELTLDTLIRLNIWEEQGAGQHFFVPSDTYSNPTDKHITTWCSRLTNDGLCYYLSYPPLAIILPYLPLKLFNFELSASYLQIINLLLHFLSAIFIYLITGLLSERASGKKNRAASVLAFSFYVFTPIMLTMYSESYFSDTVVMPFFVAGIYFFLRLIKKTTYRRSDLIIFGLLMFLACYSEWLGILFAGSAGLYTLFHWREKRIRWVFFAILTGSITALGLTLGQFISVIGWSETFKQLADKLLYRSGISLSNDLSMEQPELFSRFNMSVPSAWLRFPFHYIKSFGFFPILTVLALIQLIIGKRNDSKYKLILKPYLPFIWVAGLPAILHHLLLFQWSTLHSFSPIKAAPLFTVISGILIIKVIHRSERSALFWKITSGITVALMIFSFFSFTSHHTNSIAIIGERIANLSTSKEVLFVRNESVNKNDTPSSSSDLHGILYSYYAHRNIATWSNLDDAKQLIQKNNATSGVLFELNETNPLSLKYIRLTLQSTEKDIETRLEKYQH